ncbi:MAG: hypothetical protein RL522_3175 [Pseudomonadota bacterium]|jgi:uncharacterized membrane protein YfcA
MSAWPALLPPVLGLGVGAVLALTGAGGAIIAVPLLVFGLHLGLAQAAPIGLLAVALSAGLGAALGWRQGLLRYKAAAFMAASGLLLTPVGLWLAQRIPNAPLTLLFALVLAAVALRMLRQAARALQGGAEEVRSETPCLLDEGTGRLRWTPRCAVRLALAGAMAGLLSGLLGVGGGFVLVPALLAVSNLPMQAITATSMGVLALVSSGAVAQAALAGQVPWGLALPFAAGALTGLLAGRRFAARLAGPRLQQGFAWMALLIAAGLVVRTFQG